MRSNDRGHLFDEKTTEHPECFEHRGMPLGPWLGFDTDLETLRREQVNKIVYTKIDAHNYQDTLNSYNELTSVFSSL